MYSPVHPSSLLSSVYRHSSSVSCLFPSALFAVSFTAATEKTITDMVDLDPKRFMRRDGATGTALDLPVGQAADLPAEQEMFLQVTRVLGLFLQ